MTKADLVKSIIDKTGFSSRECTQIVEDIFDLTKTSLEKGEEVKISGFGLFVVKSKNTRRGRNPQTGDRLEIAARKVLRFKASPVLKKAMSG